jgi:hypothetical protein
VGNTEFATGGLFFGGTEGIHQVRSYSTPKVIFTAQRQQAAQNKKNLVVWEITP